MTVDEAWLKAFPLRPVADAVDALCESWQMLAAVHRPGFNHAKREPELTRALKAHVEQVTGRARGLPGMWATECVHNDIDLETASLSNERRTDIVYGWNNETLGVQLVLEFKKIDRSARSRNAYLGNDGLQRFVTGRYSQGQAVAAMVGILVEARDQVVPLLQQTLTEPERIRTLRVRRLGNGKHFELPSRLFAAAEFDTEHDRDAELALSRNAIRIAHIFLEFSYPIALSAKRARRARPRRVPT
ncbi:MAG: Fis family transcriptional regulator [Hyphomicrobium sp.]